MSTTDAIYDRLYDFIVAVDTDQKLIDPAHLALSDVRRAWQDASRPKGPYAVMQLLSERDLNETECYAYDEIAYPGAGLDRVVETSTRARGFLIDVEIYAENALDRARSICSAMNRPAASIGLLPWIVAEMKEPRFIPALDQQRWQGKAVFTFEMRGLVATKTIIDVIDGVDVAVEGQIANQTINTADISVSRS
ncbi:hypothetical protein FHT98_0630 [Bosea sp. AK1]|uniref:phage neck terminator protein n=1 Tax=Bosea sp. AK1 TaxID=2587160 RepID=UPI00115214DD|nr:hypothetical protein [Bosea sp. AK1]TQI72910.1 hypothetical protein FHT98_0630 [Bosea sp. AK1]